MYSVTSAADLKIRALGWGAVRKSRIPANWNGNRATVIEIN